jgi:hypothetical protein
MSSERDLTGINFFICSTYVDLRHYREAVINILKSHAAVINSQEFFGARSQEPLDTCLEELERSQVFILILGPRLGSIHEETGKSFIECEYYKATELGIPRFAYILDDEHPFPTKHVSKGEDAEQLRRFIESVRRELTIDKFTTAEDLSKKVFDDLLRELPKHEFKLGDVEEEFRDSPVELLKKFCALPKLFQGRNVILKGKFGSYTRATENECDAFSYRNGSAIRREFTPSDKDIARLLDSRLKRIYAEENEALELIELPEDRELEIIVKTIQGSYSTKKFIYGDREPNLYGMIGYDSDKVIVNYDTENHLIYGLEFVEAES